MGSASLSYKGHRYPVEVISHCVWLYHRFPLPFREVEELMLERGGKEPAPGLFLSGLVNAAVAHAGKYLRGSTPRTA